ncbi:MAG: hypothetical protein ACRBG0_25720 [Lewinella sp.]|uniref:hypothetical protein n=1 Tax=Lewinella sp. TaxID=2004506 RepID=UPI003D6C22D1
MLRSSILCAIVVFLFSCSPDSLEIRVYEFRHVVEEPDPSGDNFKYYHSEEELDTTEVRLLSEIFDNKGYSYLISSDGKFYHDRSQVVNIGAAFVIDNELIDSVIARNVPRSSFVKEVLQKVRY